MLCRCVLLSWVCALSGKARNAAETVLLIILVLVAPLLVSGC